MKTKLRSPDYKTCLHHHAATSYSHSFFFVVVVFSLSPLKFPQVRNYRKAGGVRFGRWEVKKMVNADG